jgi:Bacterial SH3 domain
MGFAELIPKKPSLGKITKTPPRSVCRALVCVLSGLLFFGLSACGRRGHRVLEVNYVSAPQATLRDQVATIYNRLGTVKNGERVEVLDHEKRFARVRTGEGLEGWIEERYLVNQQIYDQIQRLTQENLSDPIQAPGILRNDTNLHVTPGRESEHLYQLSSGAKVSLLKRATVEKQVAAVPVETRPGGKPTGPVLEDWWLARDAQDRVGWVLGRMVDVDAPLDVAQYAEGQRFVALFVLDQVHDDSGQGTHQNVPQYLCALTEPHDGLAYDFDQIRVFTWNVRKHRYETAYHEHGLNGVLPITVSTEDFGKEGMLPVFVIRVRDNDGHVVERKYKLHTPIVHRLVDAGEKTQPRTPHRNE